MFSYNSKLIDFNANEKRAQRKLYALVFKFFSDVGIVMNHTSLTTQTTNDLSIDGIDENNFTTRLTTIFFVINSSFRSFDRSHVLYSPF